MIREYINKMYGEYFPRFCVLISIHLMYRDNRRTKKDDKRKIIEKKTYDKWYAKHGKEYEAQTERVKEDKKQREAERIEMREDEKKQVEKEILREVQSKLKRKKLRSPRLFALRRRQLTMKEDYDFELYSEGFDRGDTARVSAFIWLMANKE